MTHPTAVSVFSGSKDVVISEGTLILIPSGPWYAVYLVLAVEEVGVEWFRCSTLHWIIREGRGHVQRSSYQVELTGFRLDWFIPSSLIQAKVIDLGEL